MPLVRASEGEWDVEAEGEGERGKSFGREGAPAEFLCPLGKYPMTDPVVAADGYYLPPAAHWWAVPSRRSSAA